MSDPISIIKLVALALSTAKATKDFIDDVVDAPNVVNAVARDLGALQGILSQLISHLQNPVFGDVQAHDQIVAMLAAPCESCAEDARKLQTLIRPFVKPSNKAKKSKWTRLAFQFRADEVRNIQQRLSNSRASLDAGVGVATLIISSRSSGRLREIREDQNVIKRRMNRLLLDRGLDISSIATSSYAATETDDPIMNWLAETETVIGEEALHAREIRRSDVVVGVDFGLTATSVAYSFGPGWSRPELMQTWPGQNFANAVDTILGYETFPGPPKNWGFMIEDDASRTLITKRNFKRYLDEEYRDASPDALTLERAEVCCVDFLTLLYQHLNQYFEKKIPRWSDRYVDYAFSVSHSWMTQPKTLVRMKWLIEEAGFGTAPKQQATIPLTNDEALAYYTLSPTGHKQSGVILLCNVGDTTTDTSTIRFSMARPQAELTTITFTEGAEIGWNLIDVQAEQYLVERLQKIRPYLTAEPDIVAHRMMRQGRYESFPDADIMDSKIFLRRSLLQSWFDRQVEKLLELVDRELLKLQQVTPTEELTYITATGSLGASLYVRRKIRARYREKYISRQRLSVDSALASGLVEHGVNSLRTKSTHP